MTYFRIFLLVITAVLSGCSGVFEEMAFVDSKTYPAPKGKLEFSFLGTSSFLIDDGKTQLLIDGFVTRNRHLFLRKIAPDEAQILQVIRKAGICRARKSTKAAHISGGCKNRSNDGLQLIVPTHAHYDHALDAPYFAAWSGGSLIADESIEVTVEASKQYFEPNGSKLNWEGLKLVKPFNVASDIGTHRAGRFNLKLIKTTHGQNPSTRFVSGKTASSFHFPANIWEMKEGTTFSILLSHGQRRALFVPSAGDIGETFRKHNVRADVVFLGIGFLGWKSKSKIRRYWNDAVTSVGAKRVFLIHWDSDQESFDFEGGSAFKPAAFRNYDRLLRVLDYSDVRILTPPSLRPFDPFSKIALN